jgi:sarcosine oxidase
MAHRSFDTVVIGLGGMGSAALYHLARRGVHVGGFDQFAPPHRLGSSHGRTRIIRLAYYEDPSYVPLLRRAYELWHDLGERTGQRLLRTTGSVDVSTMTGGIFPRSLASCERHALAHEVLTSAELSRRFPGYRFPDDYFALYQPDGGILDPERCIAAHLAAAAQSDATAFLDERVLDVDLGGSAITFRTTRGDYTAERVVLTAGAWTGQLVPRLRALAVAERQVVGWFEPSDAALFAPERFPVFNVQVDEGHYYGFPFDAVGRGVKVGRYHHLGERVDPSDYDRAIHPRDEAALRDFVARYLPAAAGRMIAAETCLFTNSPDEHFIIDRLEDASRAIIAAGFSGHGFKFCSVVGEILADLVIDGRTRHDIGLLRLDRFGTDVAPADDAT